jgi:hypothetical protein
MNLLSLPEQNSQFINPKITVMKHSQKAFPIILVMLLSIFTSCITAVEKDKSIEYPFAHHVFFWLNNPDNADERAAFEQGIADLLEIPEIKFVHFGTPANVAERGVVDGSYTYSYLVFFENKEGHDIYQDHEIHLKFIEDNKHLWSKVVVYDSVTE